MPLSINVGLSRKASRDYQSTGVSFNIVAELDSALLAKPVELQQQIDALYSQAAQAIDRQVSASQTNQRRPAPGNQPARNGNGPANGRNANTRPNGDVQGASMTASQRRAIESIAERNNVSAQHQARELFGVGVDALTLRQASELIDHLKAIPPVRRQ